MSLLPHDASFEERVQDCFTAFRGRGVMLSALDVELLSRWAEHRVPFEVVARGLRKAASRLEYDARPDEGLRSLSACRRDVEKEIEAWLRASAGQTQAPAAAPTPADPWEVQRHKKLVATLKKLAKQHVEITAEATRLVVVLAPVPDAAAAERQEAVVVGRLVRALPVSQRRPLLRDARRLVQNADPISAAARRESLRFFRAMLLGRLLDVPAFF